jgi:hypothetical protein
VLSNQRLQPKDGLGYGWVFLKILGFGWVWVFAAPIWVGFRFLFFKKPGFRLGFGFFSKFKKKIGNFQAQFTIHHMKEEKKSKEIIQFFKLIAKHWAALAGKTLGSTKNQPKSLMVNPYCTKSFGY